MGLTLYLYINIGTLSKNKAYSENLEILGTTLNKVNGNQYGSVKS